MLVHSVYFWLKKGLSEAELRHFAQGLERLKQIDCVENVFIGNPADTIRPAVDRTYDFGLMVLMKDMQAHQRYQEHPLHKEFIESHSSSWIKVVIYDFLEDSRFASSV